MATAYIERLKAAPKHGGFSMDGYWVWCGSVVQGEDGTYHMFASRWPHSLSFNPHWLTNSEIVHAVSTDPEGAYEFVDVALPTRGDAFWDGRMTHNPSIHKWGDTYVLFYTGTTYGGETPTPGSPCTPEQRLEARANQRIGVATASSVYGPWTRRDEPVLQPREGKWDALLTTNPAPCVLPDGRVLLVYKSTAHQTDLLRLGVARAPHFEGPYTRSSDGPIFQFDETEDHVEDPYIWHNGFQYELLMKDMRGGICGERGGGIHATSRDGIHWSVSQSSLAYSRTIVWDDGSTTTQGHLERVQLLVHQGEPTHLFFATADAPLREATRSWNISIPISPRPSIPLWEPDASDAPSYTEEAPPHLVPYLVAKARTAVVVCPGGGYSRRADHEGAPIARWLNSLGVSAFVLHYRVSPHQHPEPLADAQRALRLIRHRSAEWGIDSARVGILGFSAGGHLAATLSTHWDRGLGPTTDSVEHESCRPDFTILCYPVISMSAPYAHSGSLKNLLGDAPSSDVQKELSNEAQVHAETPPAFIWHTADDAGVSVEHSLDYARALRRHGVAFSLHIFPHGRHGLGLANEQPEVAQWTRLCATWLSTQGFIA